MAKVALPGHAKLLCSPSASVLMHACAYSSIGVLIRSSSEWVLMVNKRRVEGVPAEHPASHIGRTVVYRTSV